VGRKREEARWTGAKGAVKRSVVVDARGIPLRTITAPANRHDSPLLEATLDTLKTLGELSDRASVHLESAYDSATTRCGLAARWLVGEISQKD
jgi:IS5 family transposase